MADRVVIEVAIESVDDALAAEAGGADRLELCSALDLGGLTPSLGTYLEVRKAVRLPIWVMIRPRPGDFVYTEAEIRTMARDLELYRDLPSPGPGPAPSNSEAGGHGPDGFVFGVLDEAGRVHPEACRVLRYRTGYRPCAFHRAFDKTPDAAAALDQLIRLGFRRVLTSGGAKTAADGIRSIASLVRQADDRIEVMPCGGVSAADAPRIVAETGCRQVHGSFAETVPEGAGRGTRGYPPRSRTCRPKVAAARAALDAVP